MRLTDEMVLEAKPRNKEYLLSDGGGLYLRVKTNGTKLWRAEFRVPTGRLRPHIGVYPEISLKEARDLALTAKSQAKRGIDSRSSLAGGLRATLMEEGTGNSTGIVALIAGLITALKLARVESEELQSGSPHVRSAITESITIAKMVVEASRQ